MVVASKVDFVAANCISFLQVQKSNCVDAHCTFAAENLFVAANVYFAVIQFGSCNFGTLAAIANVGLNGH